MNTLYDKMLEHQDGLASGRKFYIQTRTYRSQLTSTQQSKMDNIEAAKSSLTSALGDLGID